MALHLSRAFLNSTKKIAPLVRPYGLPASETLWQGHSVTPAFPIQDKSQDKTLRVLENFLRDGVQALSILSPTGERIPLVFPTDVKLAMYDHIVNAGFSFVEIGSMVKLASMADTPEFYRSLKAIEGVICDILVPNRNGMATLESVRDLKKPVRISIFTAASETFVRKNINCTIAESLERFKPVVQKARELKIPVRGFLSCTFGCPFENKVPLDAAVEQTLRLKELCDVVVPSDTIGAATAQDVEAYTDELVKQAGREIVDDMAFHFHGNDLTRVDAALDAGVREFDVALGGIGGCPVVTKAKGNMDALHFLDHVHSKGFITGVNAQEARTAQEFLFAQVDLLRKTTFSQMIA